MPTKSSTTKRVPQKPGAGKRKKKQLSAKEVARRAEAEAEIARLALVKQAETTTVEGKAVPKDVFAGMKPFHHFEKNGVDVDIEFSSTDAMEKETKDWALDLVRRNMKPQYIAARWGWSDGEKRKELEDSHARYLICRAKPGAVEPKAAEAAAEEPKPAAAAAAASSAEDATGDAASKAAASGVDPDFDTDRVVADSKGELLAYVHFRFMLEGTAPVLYVFELQCEPRARGKGLGAHLMRALELVAYQERMQYVMLTVFTDNAGARRFYSRLGYKLDELSKSPAMLTSDVAYQILSKTIDPEVAASKETRHKALRGKVDLEDPTSSYAALSV